MGVVVSGRPAESAVRGCPQYRRWVQTQVGEPPRHSGDQRAWETQSMIAVIFC